MEARPGEEEAGEETLTDSRYQASEVFTGADLIASYLTERGWTKDADLPIWHRTEPRELSRSEQDAFAWQIAEDRSNGLQVVGLTLSG